MAEFVTQYAYLIARHPVSGDLRISLSGEGVYTVTDGDDDSDEFSLDETLTYSAEEGGDTFLGVYAGRAADGVMMRVDNPDQEYYLLLSPHQLDEEEPIVLEAEPMIVCFLAGTAIAVPEGETAVETLAIGDEVLTADGVLRQVRWIGRQTVAMPFAPALRSFPIRIAAEALGDGLPRRALFVSPDHALLIDGLLVQAGALINGTTIVQIRPPTQLFTYYHVELADHALILAEGVAAETFVDNVTRRRFDNHAEYEALYGSAPPDGIAEMPYPRVKSARQLPRFLRTKLAGATQAA